MLVHVAVRVKLFGHQQRSRVLLLGHGVFRAPQPGVKVDQIGLLRQYLGSLYIVHPGYLRERFVGTINGNVSSDLSTVEASTEFHQPSTFSRR
jgi:hypothetical protein